VAGAEAINALLEGDSVPSKPQKRADKYKTIERWTKEHLFETVTVAQIAEIGDVSNATARKFINDRVDLFRKIGGRVWEIRDPVSDRRHSKA
jgi:Fic family protein